MSYLGKTYTLERHENFDQFLAALGVPQDKIAEITAKKPTITVVKNGDTYTQTVIDQSVSFTPGVEFDENIGGNQSKTTFEVEGDTITQTQKFKNGHTLVFKKQYSGDKLVVTATNNVWDGVAYRYYSA